MIRITGASFDVTVSGVAIYLDNWAIINLAKGDSSQRRRFVDALRTGRADIVFSVGNAAELTGPQGKSRDAVRAFLDEIGPRWFPVEVDTRKVVQREQDGARPSESCIAKEFIVDYWNYQTKDYAPGSGKIIDPSEVLRLGGVLDWVDRQRDSIRKCSAELGEALINKINGYRIEHDQNQVWLDQNFPILPFHPSKPAMFTYVNLIRSLIVEAKSRPLKKNDGLDFCHSVMAVAFTNVATLDKAWKRKVECLPENTLARIYDPSQLDEMVTYIELKVKELGRARQ